MTFTPSNRVGSSINSCRPAVSTASLTVCHEAARAAATRAIDILSMTTDFSAHSTACLLSFARGAAAWDVSCRQTLAQSAHRYRRTRTQRAVGRHPSGRCANFRITVPLGTPWPPQPRHHGSSSATRHSRIARSRRISWPVTTSPSASSRQKLLRSGQVKVGLSTSRSFEWKA